jgi:glycine betaine/proline transport system substrate-binding protein
MKAYNLKNDIKPIKATYPASMAQGLANYRNGKPIFFYTWTPNWTTAKLKPGKDVMWINVPKIEPTPAQKDFVDRMTASGIKGAVTDPVKLGFVVNDIRVVANKKFLADNPAAKKFFEEFSMPLADINAQNAKMQAGQKSQSDIDRQAEEWISAHQKEWNAWLDDARAAAQ